MNFINRFYGWILVVLALLLLPVLNAYAGAVSGISVSETSVVTSESSDYTFTFTPATTINSGMWCDGAYFWFDFDNDYTVSSTTLDSISPSISGMSIVGRTDSTGLIRLWTSSGSIIGGQQYTIVLNGVQNPATPQTPVAHQVRTGEGCGTIDSGSVAASEIVSGATNPPAVQSQIPDKSNLEESAGVTQYVADLNNNFIDLDGDIMTFTASSSSPTTVAVTTSGTNGKILSIEAKKYGSANITVTATASDGSANDIFNVTTIGALAVNSISSTSDTAGQTTNLTLNVTLETTVSNSGGDGAYLYFDLPSQYGVDGSTTISTSVSGTSYRSIASSNVWFIATASTIPAGTYTVTINNVTNPGSAGSYGDIVVDTRNGGGTTYDKGSIALPAIGASNVPTVTSPISDQTGVEERDGVQQLIADLNGNFNDADGNTLTFTASSSDPTIVAVTTSGTNGRILSIEAKKYGSATITVIATSVDGSVDDEFTVSAIGELIINSITSSSDLSSQSTNLTVNFTLETIVSNAGGDGAYLYFDLPSQYGVDGSTTISTSVAGTSYRNAASSNVWFIATASTISAGTYTATINNVTNPSSGGSYGDLILDTRDGGGTTFDIGSFALPSITTSTYTVTYDGNGNTGGTPPTDSITYLQGDTVTVKGNTGNLILTGSTFIGWNTAADGSGTDYLVENTFSMGTANVTLYAQWTTSPTYSVTYDGNNNTGGNPPTDANAYEQGVTVTVKGNTEGLTRTGYKFVGWNIGANGLGTAYNEGDTFSMGTASVTLYAQWTEYSPWILFMPALVKPSE